MARRQYKAPKYRRSARLRSISDVLESQALGEKIAEQEKIQQKWDKRKQISTGLINTALFFALPGMGLANAPQIAATVAKATGANLATDYLYDMLPKGWTGKQADFNVQTGYKDRKRQMQAKKLMREADERYEDKDFKDRLWGAGKQAIVTAGGAKALGMTSGLGLGAKIAPYAAKAGSIASTIGKYAIGGIGAYAAYLKAVEAGFTGSFKGFMKEHTQSRTI